MRRHRQRSHRTIGRSQVVAVVEEPGACHPSPLQAGTAVTRVFHDYHRRRAVEGFDA